MGPQAAQAIAKTGRALHAIKVIKILLSKSNKDPTYFFFLFGSLLQLRNFAHSFLCSKSKTKILSVFGKTLQTSSNYYDPSIFYLESH
jgi:hypothetical protein